MRKLVIGMISAVVLITGYGIAGYLSSGDDQSKNSSVEALAQSDINERFLANFNLAVAMTTEKGDALLAKALDTWASDSMSFLNEESLTESNWDSWVADKKVSMKDVGQYHFMKGFCSHGIHGRMGSFIPPGYMPDIKTIRANMSLLTEGDNRVMVPLTLDGRKVHLLSTALFSEGIYHEFHIELREEEYSLCQYPDKGQAFVLAFCERFLLHPDAPGIYKITALPTTHTGMFAFEGGRTWPTARYQKSDISASHNTRTRIEGVMTSRMLHLSMSLPVIYDSDNKRLNYSCPPRSPEKERYMNTFVDVLDMLERRNNSLSKTARSALSQIRGETPAK